MSIYLRNKNNNVQVNVVRGGVTFIESIQCPIIFNKISFDVHLEKGKKNRKIHKNLSLSSAIDNRQIFHHSDNTVNESMQNTVVSNSLG